MYIQLRRQLTPATSSHDVSTPTRPANTSSASSSPSSVRTSRPSSARNGSQNNMHYHHHNHHHLECPLHQQQQRVLEARKKDIKHSELKGIKQLAKFTVNSEPQFEEWKNHEIRVKALPPDDDFRTARIDLGKGFNEYWDHLVHQHNILKTGRDSRRQSPNTSFNECTINTTESRDELMKKSFDATLKWVVDTDYLSNNKPKMITTSPSLYLLLQLPYEDDDINYHVSWLVTKFNGILYLFALENDPSVGPKSSTSFTSPTRGSASRPSSQLSQSMSSLSLSMSRSNLNSSSYNLNNSSTTDLNLCLTPAQLKIRNQELNKFRIKSFTNLVTEQLPTELLHGKHNKMVINEAKFDVHKFLYCAQINGVNEDDEFVDIRLGLPTPKKTAEYWLKLQKYWSIAVTKPSSEVIIGMRSKKPTNKFGGSSGNGLDTSTGSGGIKESESIINGVPDGRLIGIDRLKVSEIPYNVADFSIKSVAFDIGKSSSSPGSPLWEPLVSYDFLKRFIDFIDKRVMDDPSTVYKLTPEGYYGRGYSVLGVQKLSLRGCLPLVPEWYVDAVRHHKRVDGDDDQPISMSSSSSEESSTNGNHHVNHDSNGVQGNGNLYSSSVSTVQATEKQVKSTKLNGDQIQGRNGHGNGHGQEGTNGGSQKINGHELCDLLPNGKEVKEFHESELLHEEEMRELLDLQDDLLVDDQDLLHLNNSGVTCQVVTTTTVKVDINHEHERHVVQQSININELNVSNISDS